MFNNNVVQTMMWVEHFREELNQTSPTTLFDFENEPNRRELHIVKDNTTSTEVSQTIDSLKENKAPGLHDVSAELLIYNNDGVIDELTYFFNLIWCDEEVLDD